jgi:hypothetical protein
MLVMSPLLELILIALGGLATFVIRLVWQNRRPNKTDAWPVAEGTIQSVGTVVVHPRRKQPYAIASLRFESICHQQRTICNSSNVLLIRYQIRQLGPVTV